VRIAVDAMGGDFAPREIVRGALEAAKEYAIGIILVGDEGQIKAEVEASGCDTGGLVSIVHAAEVIGMNEQHPAVAVKRKKNASIVKATRLVKEGAAAAVVSAGSTGAAMATALIVMGRIKGIDRPAIAGVLPNENGMTVLLDAGANVDCKPQNLLQFGVMGYLYAKKILEIAEPRVGLLSNGEEATKGNETTLAAYPLLSGAGFNFIGNIEGRDIFRGTVDVVVCDGFIGNIVLKTGEGIAGSLFKMMKEEITKSWLAKMGTVITEPALRGFRKRIDYTEYGGAPLLGVNGVLIVCHGSSTAKAIKNAVGLAADSAGKHLVAAIMDSVSKVPVEKEGVSLVQGID